MIFPFKTDAPVYYFPWATIGLIVVNVAIFLRMLFGQIPNVESWVLVYGDGLHPVQWLSSMFLHAGFDHLLGNMLFLWVFGLVVEGKLGWWKFLASYLAIGLTQSMFEQLLMLGYSGESPGSLGASSAIFGIMAMATVWAPKNEITFAYLIFWFFGTFDVSILGLACFYTIMETVFLFLSGGSYGTGWLHLSGFFFGLPLAFVMLHRKIVDCEGWDLIHVWRDDYGAFKKEPDPQEELAESAERREHRDEQQLVDAKSQVRQYLRQGNAAAAVLLYEKMKDVGGGITLARDELQAIVQGLHKAQRWSDSAPYMADWIERFPDGADSVRVKLAQICVVELEKPGKALDLLAKVDMAKLPDKHAALVKKITAKAHHLQAEGVVELDTDAW